jgi:hypothetical protein
VAALALGVFSSEALSEAALTPLLTGAAEADTDAGCWRGTGDADTGVALLLACFCGRCGLAGGLRSDALTYSKTLTSGHRFMDEGFLTSASSS